MKNLFKGILLLAFLLYPIFVFLGLQYFDPKFLVGAILLLLFFRFVLFKNSKNPIAKKLSYVAIVAFIIIALGTFLSSYDSVKSYPVIVNFSLAIIFMQSLSSGKMPIIERIARIQEQDLPEHAIKYTRKVTVVWSVFFIINGLVSIGTWIFADIETWTLYNGFISYIFIGVLFLVEFVIRQKVKKAHQ